MKKYIFSLIAIIPFIISGSSIQGQTAAPDEPVNAVASYMHSSGVKSSGSNFNRIKNELKGAVEDVSQRTPYSSTWKTINGKIIVRYSSNIINYTDANGHLLPMSLVTGPKSYWNGGSTPSCLYPNFYSDSILITVPAGIRITFFTIDYAYETSSNIPVYMSDGLFYFSTPCGAIDTISCNEAQPGFCYLNPNTDFSSPLTSCFTPSCNVQSFWLASHLSRHYGGSGCDTSWVWYSKAGLDSIYQFSAYLEGEPIINIANTVTAQFGPCNGGVKVIASGGTPPYTYSWSPKNGTTDSIGNLCSGYYCCTITDSKGCSDSACVFVPAKVTGVNTISNKSPINIYPNPNNGNFYITGTSAGQLMELYNYLGQKVNEVVLNNTTTQIDISGNADGVYLVRISNKDGSLAAEEKLIKTP